MNPFDYIMVAVSFILGLGVTQLLSSVIAAFRSRDRAELDWIPFAWATLIFFWQLQYWWASYELYTIIHKWTVVHFTTLIAMALMLYVASALVLPSAEQESASRLRDAFRRDGRWALVMLSIYFASALLTNWFLWDVPFISRTGAFVSALAVLPLVFLWCRQRSVRVAILVAEVPLSLWAAYVMSPASY